MANTRRVIDSPALREAITIPLEGIEKFIIDLATRHGVAYIKTQGDAWSEAVTKLSGDEVHTDNSERLLLALEREGVIDSATAFNLLNNYLDEEFKTEEQPSPDNHKLLKASTSKPFDPFRDFETAGYLRNTGSIKDPERVKRNEHFLFTMQREAAVHFLATCNEIRYEDFLPVHRMLFSQFYPWAGQDRSVTAPGIAITKGEINPPLFCHPLDSGRSAEYGLALGRDKAHMRQSPGEVMGLFAYSHPFLDGNGRTMLLVHSELCYRAGFSIDWTKTTNEDYLQALTQELQSPGDQILDKYLLRFRGPRLERSFWQEAVTGE